MMKRYYKIIDGKMVFATRRIIIGEQQIINPSHEDYINAGWEEYVPPVIDYTKYEPYGDEIITSLRLFVKPQLSALTDGDAVKSRVLFDSWRSKIGINVKTGDRLYHDDKLYKVRQDHLVQEHYPPSTDTAALYEVVQAEHTGTLDDPIPYAQNMALELDKYYTQGGILYICYNPMQPMPFDLDVLHAHVKKV